jgi:hypothetical protein
MSGQRSLHHPGGRMLARRDGYSCLQVQVTEEENPLTSRALLVLEPIAQAEAR